MQGQQSVCLRAMRQKAARYCLANHQRNHWMPSQSGANVGIGRCVGGKKDSEEFLASGVELTRHVDDGDDSPLFTGGIRLNHVADLLGQIPSLFEADLSLACTRKTVGGVRHD